MTKLQAFLEGRLGASTSTSFVTKVKAAVVNAHKFEDIVTDIAVDIMDYFPLVMQLVQLEVLREKREWNDVA